MKLSDRFTHPNDAVTDGYAFADRLLEERGVETRRVVIHVLNIDEQLRCVGAGWTATIWKIFSGVNILGHT